MFLRISLNRCFHLHAYLSTFLLVTGPIQYIMPVYGIYVVTLMETYMQIICETRHHVYVDTM